MSQAESQENKENAAPQDQENKENAAPQEKGTLLWSPSLHVCNLSLLHLYLHVMIRRLVVRET